MTPKQFVEMIAELATFEEAYRAGLEESGVTDPEEIKWRMEDAQTDMSYLIGCEESLERLILDARKVIAGSEEFSNERQSTKSLSGAGNYGAAGVLATTAAARSSDEDFS